MSLLNDASLVLIPSGYKEDKVYSIIPSDGSGDLDFVRGSEGTRINSLGQVENVCWNLYPYSEAFDNGFWLKNDLTITANNTIAPNGTTTADKVSDTIGTNQDHIFNYLMNFTAGTPYTASFYVKNIDINYFCIKFMTNAFGSIKNVIFDIQNGAITTQDAGITASIVNSGNGWYRCIATCTATITTNTLYGLYVGMTSSPTSTSYTSASIKSLYLWGAQLNVGSTAKPYFPTTDRLNVPRLTYENGCPSLLLEKQSTNLIIYSEDFTYAGWLGGASKTGNTAISPDGTQNADSVDEVASATIQSLASGTFNLTSGTSYTFSIYAKNKPNGRGFIQLAGYAVGSGGSNVYANYDIVNGTIGNYSGGTADIKSVGNGWFRCTFSFVCGNTITERFNMGLITSLTSVVFENYTGDTSKGVYAWGAQAEASSYPTSYIPTTSTSVTRLADSCYKTGISSLIGQTEGTIFFDGTAKDLATFKRIAISSGSYLSSVYLDFRNDGSVVAASWTSAGLVFYYTITPSNPLNRNKYAIGYKNSDWVVYVNGTLAASQSSGSVAFSSTLNTFEFALGGNDNFHGNVNQVLLFQRRLTNTELEQLTTL